MRSKLQIDQQYSQLSAMHGDKTLQLNEIKKAYQHDEKQAEIDQLYLGMQALQAEARLLLAFEKEQAVLKELEAASRLENDSIIAECEGSHESH